MTRKTKTPVATLNNASPAAPAEPSSTEQIVRSLTKQIIEHRLTPGEKLKEQRIADAFGVSRTLVRQALYQLSQKHLIVIEQARGAFVAAPSAQEAKEVFTVRAMLEKAMVRALIKNGLSEATLLALDRHIKAEQTSIDNRDTAARVELLGDFHVLIAGLLGNEVLAQTLKDLISRCSLITLLYQSELAAHHSHDEHVQIVKAIRAKDSTLAGRLMDAHLLSVIKGLDLKA